MAYLKHDDPTYGIYDKSADKPDPEEYTLGLNSRNFGEDHLITPQVEKLPTWASYIWDNVAVMPYGRLKAGLISDDTEPVPYVIGDEKETSVMTASAHSVIAQSAYIRKTLDRDDAADPADFDVVSFIKKVMARNSKAYIAKCILGTATTAMSKEALLPVTDYELISLSDVIDGTASTTGEETLFIKPVDYRTLVMEMPSILTREQFADFYGFKDVVFMPNVENPVIFNVNKYYIGLPKGKDGELFEDFNIDKNTKEVLFELKVCGIYQGVLKS